MELIYAYVEKFSDFIYEQEFTFTQRFKVNYDKSNKKLLIKEKNYIENFFGEKIKNISLVIGKNGTGKSTLLDLLGMKMDDRNRSYSKFKDKYFIVYHMKNNLFAVEGCGLDILEDMVDDLPLNDAFPITDPYSIVVEKNTKGYKYIGYMQYKYGEDKSMNDRIIYVNVREEYNDRHSETSLRKEEDYTVFANRFHGNNIGLKEKYDFLSFLKENSKNANKNNVLSYGEFLNTTAYLRIESNIYSYSNDEKSINLYVETPKNRRRFKSVEEYKEENEAITEEQLQKKQYFILRFLMDYIYDSFNKGLLGIVKNNSKNNTEKIEKEKIEIQNKIDEYYKGIKNTACYKDQKEYLLKVIQAINNKIEERIDLGDENKYYCAVEQFVNGLDEIKEEYFNHKSINIEIETEKSEKSHILNFLSIIDKYKRDDKNNLANDIKTQFMNLSEGEIGFLDLFTKIRESLGMPCVMYGETIIFILDEPDKSFHPEWSRKFIPMLIERLNEFQEREVNYQIIISTHSPFMISDVPSDNIILLNSTINKDGINVFSVKNTSSIGQTFGANIHTILSREFFMDSTIGELAKSKINECIRFILNHKRNYKNQESKDTRKNYNCKNPVKEKKEIKYMIDIIGEPIIKNKLEKLYYEAFPEELDVEEQINMYKHKVIELQNEIINGKTINEKQLKELREELKNTVCKINFIIKDGDEL
ncbi:AAA family ATPase [Clostridium tagluense]|uniref:AAA family ATPase n=1 Tax=Clostridium tagluense TaxID=360422 RepID=UPI001CF34655|nr:AAA family ATPase [Clostridium tagluense]MCB2313468.1 AAA family ATPase [Clostridium tagluense]MCB2318265.1 AAA family ATPase [Clostridium tagluense]MCB2323067.1 AAA family ATPase [Clostridium tagluense]MCB2328049.1 AAA family ATPase [Clostridium tagluense]MCB2332795.1 AAA family ATPase [Clostridium tagluense]